MEFLSAFEEGFYPRNQEVALLRRYLIILAHSRYFSFRNWGRKNSRKLNFLEESLSMITLRAVDILESEPISSFLLSSKEDKAKASGEVFLEVEEVEMLLEEYFAMW